MTPPDFDDLEAKLRACETRDAGRVLLDVFRTKKELNRFARHLDLSLQGHTTETLREKIVATTIGYRLNSAAIRENK